MNILIVDDAEDIRLLLTSILRNAGYSDLITTDSAMQAFEILGVDAKKGAPRNKKKIDLILMDILMQGTDGIEACKKIKAIDQFRDLPVIMVTAKNEAESLDAAFKAGAIDYITKPLKGLELLARVRSALRLKEETDRRKAHEKALAQRNRELEKALKEISTLRGLIPICAHCRKVRNNEGYWQQVEVYVSEHSDARFSHGICEACAREHFQIDVKKGHKK